MTFQYDPSLEDLLDRIETSFIDAVPKCVRKLAIKEPCYAIILWYHDSATDNHTPQIGVLTQSIRDACHEQYQSDSDSRIDCLWRPQQVLDDYQLIRERTITVPKLRKQCNEAYSLMLAADQSPLPLADESGILMPYRKMIRRAAKKLADFEWSTILTVDYSFVVVALDYTGDWLYDDLEAGLTKSHRHELAKRGLLASLE